MTFACNRCNAKHETDLHPGRCPICGCPEFTVFDTDHDRKESQMKVSAPETEAGSATATLTAPEDESAIDAILEEAVGMAMAEGLPDGVTTQRSQGSDDGVPSDGVAAPMDASDSAPLVVDGAKIPSQPAAEETPEQLRARVIREFEEQVSMAAVERSRAKVAAKTANKRFEAVTEEYEEYLSRPVERLPLFDRGSLTNETPVVVSFDNRSVQTTAGKIAHLAATENAGPADPEDFGPWRDLPLSSLGLSPGILKALAEKSETTTVGHVADWTAAGNNLIDLPGIGKSKAEKIEAAMDAYFSAWARRKDYA